MYMQNSNEYKYHVEKYGDPLTFGYKDFIPMFTAEKFNADEWVELFKESGAKYIVPVAEHHDGFAMYDSKVNSWNSVNMGPKKILSGYCRKRLISADLYSDFLRTGPRMHGSMEAE